jgi:hypothetical protein
MFIKYLKLKIHGQKENGKEDIANKINNFG